MTDEMITPESMDKERLKAALDAAFIETSYDDEGDIRAKEGIGLWVLPNKDQGRIKLLANFGFDPKSSRQQRLEAVNNINRDYIVVKATVGNNDILRFEYDILVAGGITTKAFILAFKRFCSIPRPAALEHCKGILV